MNKYCYEYPRPALTVDVVLFRFKEGELETLFIQRGHEPFAGLWAYPGGFVDEGETAEKASSRELWEETNIHSVELEQLFTETTPDRDPRGWVISTVFFGCVKSETKFMAGDDAAYADWYSIHKTPELVFGHEVFLKNAIDRARFLLLNNVFGIELMPQEFNLKELYKLYLELIDIPEQVEQIVKRLIKKSVLMQIGKKWSFEKNRYSSIQKAGFLL